MILSAQQLFSDDQAITATAISENVVDLGVAGTPYDAAAPLNNDKGKGNKVCLLVQVTEAFNNLTSLDINVEVSAAAGLTSPKVLHSETIALADLVVGKQLAIDVLPNEADLRYLGLRYTVTGTAPTTGQVTAGITLGVQTNVTGA
jgi:hypothetical protein